MRRVPIGLTPGDPDGIGPEITWKAIQKIKHPIVCIGAREPFDRMGIPVEEVDDLTRRPPKGKLWLIPAPTKKTKSRDAQAGYQSGWSIEHATSLCKKGALGALVTGPISKVRLQRGGYRFNGHTDFLGHLLKVKSAPTMMLYNSRLRVSLVTTHLPLKKVGPHLTRAKIRRAAENTLDHLRKNCGIRRPRVAITALNPHAGERGVLGNEENQTITPEIRHLSRKWKGRAAIEGPFPADTLFANHYKEFDAVVSMYHDQGLIPVKLLDFAHTVNLTLGLPVIRTSVDHGVAFDIAGKGIADPSSMVSAIKEAIRLKEKRR